MSYTCECKHDWTEHTDPETGELGPCRHCSCDGFELDSEDA
jgi:hypothetical protein